MNRIFKYPLKFENVQMVEMPKGAVVLCVQAQDDFPCIWVEVDPDAPPICRSFVTYMTGELIDDGVARHYVGTYQVISRALVFHVYTDRIEYPKGS